MRIIYALTLIVVRLESRGFIYYDQTVKSRELIANSIN